MSDFQAVQEISINASPETVFGIISELKDIQHIKLASLSKERNNIVKSFQVPFFVNCLFQGSCYFTLMAA